MLHELKPGQELADGFVYKGKRIVGSTVVDGKRVRLYDVFATSPFGLPLVMTVPETTSVLF